MVNGVGMITLNELSREFTDQSKNKILALDKVSIEINPGEFLSIVGPSGCGKSTMLRIIGGLDKPTNGSVLLDGIPVQGPSYERGMVFQDPTLFPWLNVHDNIAAGLVARKVYKAKKDDVAEYIELVGLKGFEKAYPHHLSGGMEQRAAIARSLVNHPKVLLLDEPLGALDAFTRMYMQDELLRIWQERQNTMILVTHDIDEAVYLSDKILIMSPRPGRVSNIINVNLPHKRKRNSPDFLNLRNKILEMLHFVKEDEPLSYYL
ncbi:ABC transporter ATP-binding protein [Bacillota bacterium LX-D]|nr:ABC transporter ATP-binding protein [Bacillota bacterium LX-D]